MKKHYILLLLVCLVSATVHAQTFNYQWANTIGVNASNTTTDQTVLVTSALDNSDNLYVAGYFYATVDADPGAGVTLLSSNGGSTDMYFAKYSSAGTLVWAKGIGGTGSDYIQSLAIDASGNLYLGGYYNSATIDADPGTPVVNLTNAGANDGFFGKYDNTGSYIWAKSIGGTSDDYINAITVDATGNVYVGGYFNGTMDADPGTPVVNLTSNGSSDMFFAKYDASGNYIWAKSMGGTAADYIQSIALDASNSVVLGGYFGGLFDADPGAGVVTLTSVGGNDAFFGKYDNAGLYTWAKNIGSTSDDYITSVATDATGNIYVGGYFSNTMDADPSSAVVNLISTGGTDMFFGKYTSAGAYSVAKSIGGTSSDYVQSIAVDAGSNIYISGYFGSATMDADPGTATVNVTNPGANSLFWGKYNTTGGYVWAMSAGGTNNAYARTIKYSNTTNAVYIAGSHNSSPIDMDPGTPVSNITMVGDPTYATNGLFARYNCGGVTPSVSINATATVICAGTSVTFTATPTNGGATPSYQWKKNSVNVGTNSSTYTDNTLNNNDVVTCVLTSNAPCLTTTLATSNSITITYATTLTATISISTASTSVCSGSSTTFTAAITNGGPGPVYQWKLNGTNAGTNSNTYTNSTLATGDVVSCTLTSNAPCIGVPTASSNTLTMTVNPLITPSVTITTPNTAVCGGTNVAFSAAPSNGGSAPSYQWKKNSVNVGTNSPTYNDNTLNNSDAITCIMTSNAACASPTTGTSNTLTMAVSTPPPATITYTGTTTFCANDSLILNAPTGAGYTYQWKQNGNMLGGANGQTYKANATGSYTVIVTNSQNCSATSTAVVVTVNAIPVVVITHVSPLTFCDGSAIVLNTYSTTPGFTYQWLKDGINIPGDTFKNAVVGQSGKYTVFVTNSFGCSATSDTVTVTVNPLPTPAITKTGNMLSTGTYVSYQWYLFFQPISGATNQTLSFASDGPYNVAVTDGNGCVGLSPVLYINAASVSEVNNNEDIIVYPNPAQNKIFIKSPVTVYLTVLDMHGKVIEKDKQASEINISRWADGVYMIGVFDKEHHLLKNERLLKTSR